jgi:group I intron endonuclease
MAVIYKATNKINGKCYIGFDSNWPKRKYVHKHNAEHINENTSYLHRAIRKHGWENFEWEVIKENATLEDEILLIEKYQTLHIYGKGYNLTKGGDGNLGWIMTEETKQKISNKALGNKNCLGRILSEETKNKISNSLKEKPSSTKGKPSPLRGRKQSPELIEKRISARMNTFNKNKRVLQGF